MPFEEAVRVCWVFGQQCCCDVPRHLFVVVRGQSFTMYPAEASTDSSNEHR